MDESSEIRGSGATFRYQDRIRGSGVTFRHRIEYGSGATFRYQDRIYGSGVTFRHQDRMRIRVSRSDTRIEERSVTYRHERNKDNES